MTLNEHTPLPAPIWTQLSNNKTANLISQNERLASLQRHPHEQATNGCKWDKYIGKTTSRPRRIKAARFGKRDPRINLNSTFWPAPFVQFGSLTSDNCFCSFDPDRRVKNCNRRSDSPSGNLLLDAPHGDGKAAVRSTRSVHFPRRTSGSRECGRQTLPAAGCA